jgi:DNA-binding MarR family transcriptional regulator
MQVSQTLKALERKKMVSRRRSQSDTRAKRAEITAMGLRTLRDALPRVIAVQYRLFGEAGRPGGALLERLLHLDSRKGDIP